MFRQISVCLIRNGELLNEKKYRYHGRPGVEKNLARNLYEIDVLAMKPDRLEAAKALAQQYGLLHEASFEAALSAPEINAVAIATMSGPLL